MSEGKQIRIAIVVDQNSTDNAKRLIEDVNNSLKQLIENANRASQAMGGVSGVKVAGGGNTVPGTNGVMHQATSNAAQNRGGGILAGISSGLGSLKDSAKTANDAFRSITDGIRAFAGTADSVNKFTESVKQLNQQLSQLKANGGGDSIGGNRTLLGMGPQMPGYGGGGGSSGGGGSGGGGGHTAPGAPSDPGPSRDKPAPTPKPPGPKEWEVGPDAFNSRTNGFARGIGSALGFPGLSVGMGPAGAIGAGIALSQQLVGSANDAQVAGLQNATEQPFWEGRRRSAWGAFAHQAQAQRRGNITNMVAEKLSGGRLAESMRKITSPEYKSQMEALIEHQLGFAGTTGSLGDVASTVKDGLGAGLNSARSWAFEKMGLADGTDLAGMTPAKKDSLKQAMMQRLEEQMPGKLMELQQQAVNDPRNIRTIANTQDIYSNAQNLQSMAVSGFSGGIGGVDPKTGLMRYNSLKSNLLKSGFSEGEYFGTRSQVGNSLGPEYLGNSGRIMSWQGSGYGGGMGIGGAAASMGMNSKGLGSLFSTIQGTMGRGGNEIGASTAFSSTFANQIQQQSLSTVADYGASYQTFAGGISALGGDQNAAGIYGAGMREQDSVNKGGKDQLQQALNMNSAVKAFGANWAAAEAVGALSVAEREAILKTGRIPPGLAAVGVTKETLAAYVKDQNKNAFVRFANTKGVGDTDAGRAVKAFQAAGSDMGAYLKGSSGKDRKAKLANLGYALGATGMGERAGMGYVQRLAEEAGFRTTVKGRGAFRQSAGGSTQTALSEQSGVEADEARVRGQAEKDGTTSKLMGDVAKGANEREAGAKAGASRSAAGMASEELNRFSAALTEATIAIKGAFGAARKVAGH